MNLKNLFTASAILSLIYGVFELFMPGAAVSTFSDNAELTPLLSTTVRFIGGSLIGIAILSWFMRDASVSFGRRAGLFALATSNLIFGVIQVMGIMDGTLNATNWVGAILSLALCAGFAYYANKEHTMIVEREAKEKVKA